MFITNFLQAFFHYAIETVPALLMGLIISGIIHECVPDAWINKYMSKKGIGSLLIATLIGTIAPVCCWGALPVAVSFHKKGASLGPVFAILVATPATSVNALFVTWKLMGMTFAITIFFAVIIMGLCMGLLGNCIKVKDDRQAEPAEKCYGHKQHEQEAPCCRHKTKKKPAALIFKEICKFAFIDMPKEIGFELLIGLGLAALVVTVNPIGEWINTYLAQGLAYVFAIIFGLVMYMCSTMSVPVIHAFTQQGMNIGAGMTLLILGPIASFGTILVLRKEFGIKVLLIFLSSVCLLSLIAGWWFAVIL